MGNMSMFMSYLEGGFSKAFLGSQSLARHVLKDRLMTAVRPGIKRREFEIVSGMSKTTDLPAFDESRAGGRGNEAGVYSSAYRLDDIPAVFDEIIARHQHEIVEYLGLDFLYEPPLMFRTRHLPRELETYDVYSNVWHLDSHDGERLLKIFVCLMDIGEEDGPFTYLDRKHTLKYWPELVERWDFKKISTLPHFSEERHAIGTRGTYLIINTANCMHRSSNPQNYRDMVQITLFPKWCQAADRETYKPQ